jgi:bifunctional NMN adenylyltransferase/nudix hydrolase
MEMKEVQPTAEVGVIIARFQTPALHDAHRSLINTVKKRHKKVLILLGKSPTKATRNNPLDVHTRRLMVNKEFPDVTVLPVKDIGDDEAWSKEVDSQIRSVFDIESVVIYGSRDSFIPYYNGAFTTVKLESSNPGLTGTEIRRIAADEVRVSEDFCAGAIYAAYNRHPTVYPTVDAAIWNEKTDELLLGRKKTDKNAKWRFVGGFVSPTDDSFEDAAKREVHEETGLIGTIDEPIYIGTLKIDDWRYRREVDKIITTFYLFKYEWGMVKANDDIDELKWFKVQDLAGSKEKQTEQGYQMVEEHKPLLEKLLAYFKKEQ